MDIQLAIQAARMAYKAMKNENTRIWIIIILLSPVILIVLFFAVIVYIITAPLDTLQMVFGGDFDFESFKNQSAIVQYSAIDNYEAIDFSRKMITQADREIVYYNQLDLPWKNMLYGTSASIGRSGCGPTSMAIILSTLLGRDITPAEMADWSYTKGYLVGSVGNDGYDYSTSHAFIPAVAKAYGLQCVGVSKGSDTAEKVLEALYGGKFVVAIMGSGHFTTGGHFIILSGVNREGKVLVTDCASRIRTAKAWDIDLIVSEAKGYARAGGPFWIID